MIMDFRIDRATELADQVRSGERTAVSLTAHALERIEVLNPQINAFVAIDAHRALEQAEGIDQVIAAGGDPGPLAGIPIGVKDLEDAAGLPTTHGSPLHDDASPARGDSPLVARLRRAGCVVVGKTNTPEFGFGPRSVNPRTLSTASPAIPGTSRTPRVAPRAGPPPPLPRAWSRWPLDQMEVARSASPPPHAGSVA